MVEKIDNLHDAESCNISIHLFKQKMGHILSTSNKS
jgi:hypothetical protein